MARWTNKKETTKDLEEKLSKKNSELIENEGTADAQNDNAVLFESVEKALNNVNINLGEDEIESEIGEKTISMAEIAIGSVKKIIDGVGGIKKDQKDFSKKISSLSQEDAIKEVEKEIQKAEQLKSEALKAQENYKNKPNFQKQHFWNGMHFDF